MSQQPTVSRETLAANPVEIMLMEVGCAITCLQTSVRIAHRYRLLALEERLKKAEASLATVQAQLMEMVREE